MSDRDHTPRPAAKNGPGSAQELKTEAQASPGLQVAKGRASTLAKAVRDLATTDLDGVQARYALEALGFIEFDDARVHGLLRDLLTDVKPDFIKVGLRMLAKRLESGELVLPEDKRAREDEHADWDESDIATEVAPWPARVDSPAMRRGQELHQEIERAVAAAVDETENVSDADLLRALADDLSTSKSQLHRAAVVRLYEIAERLEATKDSSSMKEDEAVAAWTRDRPDLRLAAHYIELEARVRVLETEKIDNAIARGYIKQEIDNLVTGTAFMDSRVESCSGSIRALEERIDHTIPDLEQRIDGAKILRLDLGKEIDALKEKFAASDDQHGVVQDQLRDLGERTLTTEELATIRAGLAEEPLVEEPLVCSWQSRDLGACAGVVRQNASTGPLCEEHYTVWSAQPSPTFGSQ